MIMKKEITQRMRELYKAGRYTFTAPPVCTDQWDDDAWIRFVTFDQADLDQERIDYRAH